MPRIPWPKKTPKDEADKKDKKGKKDEKLQATDGILRKLAEKELVLEAEDGQVKRYRLLAKTQFRNPDGESIRDSLLQPGDHISVEVNPEDEETAIRVIMVRAGTAEERAAASKPVEAGPAPVSAGTSSGAAAKPPTAASAQVEPAAERTKAASSGDPVLDAAREAAGSFTAGLPNFVVEQVTTRSVSNNNELSWTNLDIVTAEVASVDGKEQYRNIRVNGQPSRQPIEKTGSWSTGEFVVTLEDLFSPGTDTKFTKTADDWVGSRRTWVYDYTVDPANSHWVLMSDSGKELRPGYRGKIWIDKETKRVIRIEQRATSIPQTFPQDKAETVIEYGFVKIDAGTFLLPVSSQTVGCRRGTMQCSKNEIEFRNYRKFSADSSIKFD